MKEEWKMIPGYDGLYQVSNLGRVKSLRFGKERILKHRPDTQGYLVVTLSKNGKSKTFRVHILVAMAFLNHTIKSYRITVKHIDNNKLNNRLDNLERVNRKDKGTSKLPGVSLNGQGTKWVARIKVNGEQRYIGTFDSEYEAHLAYVKELGSVEPNHPYFKGLFFREHDKKWCAVIRLNDYPKFLGSFDSQHEAYLAYMKALAYVEPNRYCFKGLYFRKNDRKWGVFITVNGQKKYLGRFNTRDEAYSAYMEAKKIKEHE